MSDNLVSPGFKTPLAGQPLPSSLSLHWIQGEPIDLTTSPPPLLVLDFFGTMCSDCIESMPELSDLEDDFKSKGLVVVGVHILERRKTVQDLEVFVGKKANELRYRVVKDLDKSAENGIWRVSGLEAMPGLVVVKDGKVLWSGYEVAELKNVLAQM